jgi:uncharacterized protein
MGAQKNKQVAQDAYRAFGSGDAEGAMQNMDASIEWTVRGDNALTGTYNGKEEVGELWGKFLSKSFSTKPHDFIADGDKVVILTTVTLDGETNESADVSTYNADGKLVAFDTLADETAPNRVFAKEPTSPWAPTHLAGPRPSARDRIQTDMIGALGSDASDDAGFAPARLRRWCGSARRRPGERPRN